MSAWERGSTEDWDINRDINADPEGVSSTQAEAASGAYDDFTTDEDGIEDVPAENPADGPETGPSAHSQGSDEKALHLPETDNSVATVVVTSTITESQPRFDSRSLATGENGTDEHRPPSPTNYLLSYWSGRPGDASGAGTAPSEAGGADSGWGGGPSDADQAEEESADDEGGRPEEDGSSGRAGNGAAEAQANPNAQAAGDQAGHWTRDGAEEAPDEEAADNGNDLPPSPGENTMGAPSDSAVDNMPANAAVYKPQEAAAEASTNPPADKDQESSAREPAAEEPPTRPQESGDLGGDHQDTEGGDRKELRTRNWKPPRSDGSESHEHDTHAQDQSRVHLVVGSRETLEAMGYKVEEWGPKSHEWQTILALVKQLVEELYAEAKDFLTVEIMHGLDKLKLPSDDVGLDAFSYVVVLFDALETRTVPPSLAGKAVTWIARAEGVPEPFAVAFGSITKVLLASVQRRNSARPLVDGLIFADIATYVAEGDIKGSPGLYYLLRKEEASVISRLIDELVAILLGR